MFIYISTYFARKRWSPQSLIKLQRKKFLRRKKIAVCKNYTKNKFL